MSAEHRESRRVAAGTSDAGRLPIARELQLHTVPAPSARKVHLDQVHVVTAPTHVHSVTRKDRRYKMGKKKRPKRMRQRRPDDHVHTSKYMVIRFSTEKKTLSKYGESINTENKE